MSTNFSVNIYKSNHNKLKELKDNDRVPMNYKVCSMIDKFAEDHEIDTENIPNDFDKIEKKNCGLMHLPVKYKKIIDYIAYLEGRTPTSSLNGIISDSLGEE